MSYDPITILNTWTPTLTGSTDAPTSVSYTTQLGRYKIVGSYVFFSLKVVTTSMVKTTLTDNFRITLPKVSANVSNQIFRCPARLENGTPVTNGMQCVINPNTGYGEFTSIPVASASSLITYGLTSLGVLTNTITIEANGFYEI